MKKEIKTLLIAFVTVLSIGISIAATQTKKSTITFISKDVTVLQEDIMKWSSVGYSVKFMVAETYMCNSYCKGNILLVMEK